MSNYQNHLSERVKSIREEARRSLPENDDVRHQLELVDEEALLDHGLEVLLKLLELYKNDNSIDVQKRIIMIRAKVQVLELELADLEQRQLKRDLLVRAADALRTIKMDKKLTQRFHHDKQIIED